MHDPSRPIGWELLEDETSFYYRVTQMNHKPKPLAVYRRGIADPVPVGKGKIGSVVVACRRIEDPPQNAEVTEQKDEGDEVSSQLKKIASIDPLLAQCAVLVGDPDQTAAMAKFAEGKMSYAEMRMLCG
jgi:hypothetical protein